MAYGVACGQGRLCHATPGPQADRKNAWQFLRIPWCTKKYMSWRIGRGGCEEALFFFVLVRVLQLPFYNTMEGVLYIVFYDIST